MQYRSQGFDRFVQVGVKDPPPESFQLVRTRVPVQQPERHLLAGALLPAGSSPPGVRLDALGAYRAPLGRDTELVVGLVNGTASDLQDLRLELTGPDGWSLQPEGAQTVAQVAPGAETRARFTARPGPEAAIDRNARLTARYSARHAGYAVSGAIPVVRRAVAALSVAFHPLFDVAAYRDFARESGTEWVIETLPTRVPLVIGRVSEVVVDVSNAATAPASGELAFELPPGLRLLAPRRFSIPAGGADTVAVRLEASAEALPAGRHSARLPIAVSTSEAGSRDAAEAFLLPAVTVPRVAGAPEIDGDLADLASLPAVEIGPADRWWRQAPESPADLSATARLGYDERFLYVGVSVRDQQVVCNIAPDDVRAQLRSDAVGITVDPSGSSRDTSTTLQAAAFPCTTAGWGARGFRDADASQGPAEQTAPGLKVVSRRTAEGYAIEWAIPWAAMPTQPKPGDEIGLNIVLYDGDQQDARVGANISESGLAWAAFEWGGKQALPYLWGRARLAR